MIISIIIILKILATLMFLVALVYSFMNYSATKYASGIWLFFTLAMATLFVLTFIRTSKEFYWADELEIVKTFLIPVAITFLLVAAMELKRSILKPL